MLEIVFMVIFMTITVLFVIVHTMSDDSFVTGILFFVMVGTLTLFYNSFKIPNKVEQAKKEASFQCQFEECPYQYRVKTEQDTVLRSSQ